MLFVVGVIRPRIPAEPVTPRAEVVRLGTCTRAAVGAGGCWSFGSAAAGATSGDFGLGVKLRLTESPPLGAVFFES
ncbi:MAG: hypothetical protein QM784_15470 [Polyangiaceae bacterium]